MVPPLNRGFTLIELLVVIAIIGLLATMAVVSFGSAQVKARDAKRLADIKSIRTALLMYYDDTGVYPCPGASEILMDDQSVCLAGALAPYIGTLPLDPRYGYDGSPQWGNDYIYASDGTYYRIRTRLEGAAVKRTSSYPNGTLCQDPAYPTCPWNGQDCYYMTGTSCNEYWIHLSGF